MDSWKFAKTKETLLSFNPFSLVGGNLTGKSGKDIKDFVATKFSLKSYMFLSLLITHMDISTSEAGSFIKTIGLIIPVTGLIVLTGPG
ncbi:7006_t:CDS:2 [Funneliformis caledonium]|uniref:7006_t:CDS:1 n=1 Tax=Funneliformis caledonium TaxID=1117310 RepID=A0A9N8W3H8_9GLOM|nr:7006_t:CDS:2 [Funneliformis caledonium]